MPKEPVDLVAHPSAPPHIAVRVEASAMLDARGLVVSFVLHGDPAALALPARAVRAARRDRLWEHTCCEAFVGTSAGAGYLELNLAPSGDWALWAFDGYRTGMRAAAAAAPPQLRVILAATELRIDAILDATVVRGFLGDAPYVVGLATVVEERDGWHSFFACRHAAERPDFHARDGWTLVVYPSADA